MFYCIVYLSKDPSISGHVYPAVYRIILVLVASQRVRQHTVSVLQTLRRRLPSHDRGTVVQACIHLQEKRC